LGAARGRSYIDAASSPECCGAPAPSPACPTLIPRLRRPLRASRRAVSPQGRGRTGKWKSGFGAKILPQNEKNNFFPNDSWASHECFYTPSRSQNATRATPEPPTPRQHPPPTVPLDCYRVNGRYDRFNHEISHKLNILVNSPDKRPKSSKTAQIPAFRVEKPSQILSEQLQVHPQIPHLPMVVDVEQEPFGKKNKIHFWGRNFRAKI
jgi:hypothetical protein